MTSTCIYSVMGAKVQVLTPKNSSLIEGKVIASYRNKSSQIRG